MDLTHLGSTGLSVSRLGLGTVKFGRNTGVKYPSPFDLPSDDHCRALLDAARDLGINLIDTAPAYGASEERLGRLLQGDRDRWMIVTKCGEEFDGTSSRFDFSAKSLRAGVERSLRRLRTDRLELVLIHSDGQDEAGLVAGEAGQTLRDLKREGKIVSTGLSAKTLEGAQAAAESLDVVMVTYNLADSSMLPFIRHPPNLGHIGILVKKPLASGWLPADQLADAAPLDPIERAMAHIFREANISAAIVGTLSLEHLRRNVHAAIAAIRVDTQ